MITVGQLVTIWRRPPHYMVWNYSFHVSPFDLPLLGECSILGEWPWEHIYAGLGFGQPSAKTSAWLEQRNK